MLGIELVTHLQGKHANLYIIFLTLMFSLYVCLFFGTFGDVHGLLLAFVIRNHYWWPLGTNGMLEMEPAWISFVQGTCSPDLLYYRSSPSIIFLDTKVILNFSFWLIFFRYVLNFCSVPKQYCMGVILHEVFTTVMFVVKVLIKLLVICFICISM